MRVHQFDGADGVCVIEADESLNEKTAAASLPALDEALERSRLVILDCSALAQITSAGVGNILRLKMRVSLRDAVLRLAALQPNVADVMDKARAGHVVEMFDDVQTAAVRRIAVR